MCHLISSYLLFSYMFLSELTGHIVWIQQAAACFLTNRNSVASTNHILSQGSQGMHKGSQSEGLKTYFHPKNLLETFGNHILLTRFHMLSNLQVAVGKSDTLMIPHWGNNVRKTDSTERTWSRKLSGHYFQLRNQAVHFKMQRAMTHPGFTTQFGVFSGPSSKSTRAKAIHVQLWRHCVQRCSSIDLFPLVWSLTTLRGFGAESHSNIFKMR